jgi:endonuclease-3
VFGKPRLGNPRDPVDDLIFLMLSNRTQFDTAKSVFKSLKALGDWDFVSRLPVKILESKIQVAGLAKIRSRQMKRALQLIAKNFGSCRLSELRNWEEQDAHDYLAALPGVSDKVAKCVMMYTLGFEVLPVDIHVFRVSSRLGWTSRCRADQCHHDLELLVPPEWRFGFHVDCILLGRSICTAQSPDCPSCPIRKYCFYFQQHNETWQT